MNTKLFGYARVSTTEQNLERQLDLLKEYGVCSEDIYTEKISGASNNRPALEELKKVLRPGDTVVTESLSRLSRSTQDLLSTLNVWRALDITYISIKERLDFSSTTGQLILTILAALSQFERDIIRNRVNEGLASARARGRIGGRPRTDKKELEKAIKLYDTEAYSVSEITKLTRISKSVIYRELKIRSGGS